MTGFLVKKTLIDATDNLPAVLLMNSGFLAVIAAVYGLNLAVFALVNALFPSGGELAAFLGILVIMTASGALVSIYAGGAAGVARELADGRGVAALDFFRHLVRAAGSSLVFGAAQGLAAGLLLNAGLFYLPLAVDRPLFFLAFCAAFWLWLYQLAAGQYYFPLQARFDKKPFKNMRKMLLLVADNFAFTVLCLAPLSLLAFGLSFATILLFPGISGIVLLHTNALKLRLLKYDYLETHPGASRRRIPWADLLAAERERVGNRDLRSVFFPWKR